MSVVIFTIAKFLMGRVVRGWLFRDVIVYMEFMFDIEVVFVLFSGFFRFFRLFRLLVLYREMFRFFWLDITWGFNKLGGMGSSRFEGSGFIERLLIVCEMFWEL